MNKDLFAKTLIAASIAGVLGLSACNKDRPEGQVSDTAAAEAPKESASLGAAVDDTGITAQVKGKLASDARTKDSDIAVETNNGIVTLSGSVATAEAKNAAEEQARYVAEVQGVDNKLNAPSTLDEAGNKAEVAAHEAGGAVSDTVITTKVKAKLAADETVKARDIKVDTSEGVVTLSGNVPNESARDRAVSITKNTDGVKNVRDTNLIVGKEKS